MYTYCMYVLYVLWYIQTYITNVYNLCNRVCILSREFFYDQMFINKLSFLNHNRFLKLLNFAKKKIKKNPHCPANILYGIALDKKQNIASNSTMYYFSLAHQLKSFESICS